MTAYEIAHHNAHIDPMNAAKWKDLYYEAKRDGRDKSAYVAWHCARLADAGTNPLSDDGQDAITVLLDEYDHQQSGHRAYNGGPAHGICDSYPRRWWRYMAQGIKSRMGD